MNSLKENIKSMLRSVIVKEQEKIYHTGELRVVDMAQDCLNEIKRLEYENEELKHEAKIGRATLKAFENHDYLDAVKCFEKEEEQIERYVDEENSHKFDSVEDLLYWDKEDK